MNETIFHYTTVDSLLGITASTSNELPYFTFWATEASYMNDPEEKRLGIRVLNVLYDEIENQLEIPVKQRLATFRNSISDFPKSTLTKVDHPIYLVSFSEDCDSLPMWEMYAKRGNGINLGFDPELVLSYEKKSLASLSKVLYRPHDMDQIIEKIKNLYIESKEEVCTLWKNLLETGKTIDLKEDEFTAELIYYALVEKTSWWFKHEAYEYEKEIRLAIPQVYHVFYRERNGFIIPYMELKIPVKALKSITFGPTADNERLSAPIRQLLHSKGVNLENIEFLNSKVPYRM